MGTAGERISTRRSMMVAALGGLAATAAHAIGRPLTAAAADGDVVHLGASHVSFTPTSFTGDQLNGYGTALQAFGGTAGLYASSNSDAGAGVIAIGSAGVAAYGEFGVIAKGWTGVKATGDNVGVFATAPLIAVEAELTDSSGVAAVRATAPVDGMALEVYRGHVHFSTSGLAVVNMGSDRVTVTPGFDIVDESKVLAVLQGDPGKGIVLSCVSRDFANDRFSIVLSRPAKVATPVAWFVLR